MKILRIYSKLCQSFNDKKKYVFFRQVKVLQISVLDELFPVYSTSKLHRSPSISTSLLQGTLVMNHICNAIVIFRMVGLQTLLNSFF